MNKYERAAHFATFCVGPLMIRPDKAADLCRLTDAVFRAGVLVANAGVAVKNGCGRFEHQEKAFERAKQKLEAARATLDAFAATLGLTMDHAGTLRPTIRFQGCTLFVPEL